jgi:DNA-binding NarL/FixJ family response regulator
MSMHAGLDEQKSSSHTKPLRIVIVDDHPIVRKGLTELINNEPDLTVCGESDTVDGGVERIRTERPDVAILDLSLGTASGLQLVKTLSAPLPDVRVLVLSMHDETLHAERALAAGASGYIMKHEAMEHLLGAIRRVARGKAYVSPRMSERILARVTGRRVADDRAPFERLTDREREVFALIGRGLRTRDIARELVLQWTALPQDQPDGRPQASGWLTSPVPLEGCNRLIRSPSVERLIVRSSGTQEGTNAWEHRFNVSGRDHRGSLSTPSPASCAIVARVL